MRQRFWVVMFASACADGVSASYTRFVNAIRLAKQLALTGYEVTIVEYRA